MGTARCQFTDEFTREAVGLLASSRRPLSQIAQELGIAASRLYLDDRMPIREASERYARSHPIR